MKPTEAKEWIDKLVKTGMKRDAATVLVNEAAALPEEVALCALGMTYGARAAAIPVEPEPPPVEIPRRVVWLGDKGWLVRGTMGEVVKSYGVVREGYYSGKEEVFVQWDGENGAYIQWIDDKLVVELQLTKAEQARLLLEKLSRECYPFFTGDDSPENCWLNQDGSIGSALMIEEAFPYFVPIFPSFSRAESARDAIIRAGLAWWEKGE